MHDHSCISIGYTFLKYWYNIFSIWNNVVFRSRCPLPYYFLLRQVHQEAHPLLLLVCFSVRRYLSKQGLAVIKLFSWLSTVGSFTFAVGFRSSFQSFCFLLDHLNPLASTPGLVRFFYVIGRFQKTSGALGSPAMRDRAWFVSLYGGIIPEL